MICFPPSSTRHVFNLVDSVRESSGKRKYLFIALRGFNFDFPSLCYYRLPVDQYPVGYEFDIDKVRVMLESSCLFEVYEVAPPLYWYTTAHFIASCFQISFLSLVNDILKQTRDFYYCPSTYHLLATCSNILRVVAIVGEVGHTLFMT